MAMQLYTFPPSPNARRAMMASVLCNQPVETKFVDLPKGEAKSPAYLRINPNGKIPALVDGDTSIFESIAIMQYMADKAGNTPGYPADPRKRAEINKWLAWCLSSWDPVCGTFTFENVVKPMLMNQPADAAALKLGAEKMAVSGAVLDNHLAGRDWLCGNGLTLADLAIASPLMYAQPAKMPVDGFANVKRWLGNVEKTEAWQRTQPKP